MEIIIKTLPEITLDILKHVITGYVSDKKYVVRRTENQASMIFSLELTPLDTLYTKQYQVSEEDIKYYQSIVSDGISLAAYHGDSIVGIAIASLEEWNNSLRLHEFHILDSYRRRGIGRQMMARLVQNAQEHMCRIIVLETQNTNSPAICFYQQMGFQLEGFDLSLYSNDDYPDGEIAFFMKRRIKMLDKVPTEQYLRQLCGNLI